MRQHIGVFDTVKEAANKKSKLEQEKKMLISLAEYAAKHGKAQVSARSLAASGGFQTAKKIGRNWVIDDAEPWPDSRVKSGQYKDWRKPKEK